MSARTSAMLFGFLAVLLWPDSLIPQTNGAAEAGKAASAGQQVVFTLRIAEPQSGFVLDAKKSVSRGSNAFEVLRETVAIKYKTFPKLGAFVTGLCGVDAPKGKVWTFSVDTRWSEVGIGNLTLERDAVIEWTLR